MFLLVIAISFSFILLFLINFVMARYDQLDAAPIYASMNMVMSILCGLILLGERDRYPTANFVGLIIAVVTIVAGTLVLGYKKTQIKTQKVDKAK